LWAPLWSPPCRSAQPCADASASPSRGRRPRSRSAAASILTIRAATAGARLLPGRCRAPPAGVACAGSWARVYVRFGGWANAQRSCGHGREAAGSSSTIGPPLCPWLGRRPVLVATALGAAATLLRLAQSTADTAWLWAGADAFAGPRLGRDVGLVSPGYWLGAASATAAGAAWVEAGRGV